MSKKELRAIAREIRENVKRADLGYTPTIQECLTYITESLAMSGFEESHKTKCYKKHGVAYCELVAQWYYWQTKNQAA